MVKSAGWCHPCGGDAGLGSVGDQRIGQVMGISHCACMWKEVKAGSQVSYPGSLPLELLDDKLVCQSSSQRAAGSPFRALTRLEEQQGGNHAVERRDLVHLRLSLAYVGLLLDVLLIHVSTLQGLVSCPSLPAGYF